MINTVDQMKTHLRQWEPFRDTWEVNKDNFIDRYEQQNNPVDVFDSDIGKYVFITRPD